MRKHLKQLHINIIELQMVKFDKKRKTFEKIIFQTTPFSSGQSVAELLWELGCLCLWKGFHLESIPRRRIGLEIEIHQIGTLAESFGFPEPLKTPLVQQLQQWTQELPNSPLPFG